MTEILTSIESLSLYNYHSVFMVGFVMIDHKIILLVGVIPCSCMVHMVKGRQCTAYAVYIRCLNHGDGVSTSIIVTDLNASITGPGMNSTPITAYLLRSFVVFMHA